MSEIYYTLNEAAQKLGMLPTEVKHGISEGSIFAAIHLSNAKLLCVSPSDGKGWIVHAQFSYTGPAIFQKKAIIQLIDYGETDVSTSIGRALIPEKVQHWHSELPWKTRLPQRPIYDWEGRSLEDVLPDSVNFIHCPAEVMITGSYLEKLIDSIAKGKDVTTVQETLNSVETRLNFEKAMIAPDNLRISSSEIQRLTTKNAPKESSPPPLEREGRENQLHTLIARIISKTEITTAKKIWNEIYKDFLRDDPIYDIEGILRNVSSDEIEWESRHGSINHIRLNSFRTAVARTKDKLTPNLN